MLTRIENVKQMINPNMDLLSKVAFLKTSIDFIIEEVGLKPVKHNDNACSVANLRAQYVRNKNLLKLELANEAKK